MQGAEGVIFLGSYDSDGVSALLLRLGPVWSCGHNESLTFALHGEPARHLFDSYFDVPKVFLPTARLEQYSYHTACGERGARLVDSLLARAEGRLLVINPEWSEGQLLPKRVWRDFMTSFTLRYQQWTIAVLGSANHHFGVTVHGGTIVQCHGMGHECDCSLITRSAAFVGGDAATLRIADLARIPSVGIFGAGNFYERGLRFTEHRYIIAPFGNLEHIQATDLIEAVDAVIQGSQSNARGASLA